MPNAAYFKCSTPSSEMSSARAIRNSAFSLVELLVCFGLFGLLLSVLLPTLANMRYSARSQVSANNLRTLGILTTAYAGENMDFPPVSFAPVYGRIPNEPQIITATDGTTLRGWWFNNATLPHARFDRVPPGRCCVIPRLPASATAA